MIGSRCVAFSILMWNHGSLEAKPKIVAHPVIMSILSDVFVLFVLFYSNEEKSRAHK